MLTFLLGCYYLLCWSPPFTVSRKNPSCPPTHELATVWLSVFLRIRREVLCKRMLFPTDRQRGALCSQEEESKITFQWLWFLGMFFLQIHTFTAWRFAQETLELDLFLLKQYPEGAHMLYLPSHRVHNHKIAVYCGEAQQQKYQKKRLGEGGRRENR